MEDSCGYSKNTNAKLPRQENKEGRVLLCDPDLLLGSPSSFPDSEHRAYKPLRIFRQMSYLKFSHIFILCMTRL